MSKDWFADVLEFHRKMSSHIGTEGPKFPDAGVQNLRDRLDEEEYRELRRANMRGDLPRTADGIVDLIYTLLGRAVAYGIDVRPLWDEVHRTNMAKLGGEKRADGKCLKPPGWQPPDIAGFLARQKPLNEGVESCRTSEP